jgi:predicted SprT family Zn-dependent metalloprotease
MDQKFAGFKFCDSRLFPYLEKVMNRLPDQVQEDVFNNQALQILADETTLDACARRYAFDPPAETLIYLNPKILIEPEHVIICILAHEIAHTVLAQSEPDPAENAIEDLLIEWGFVKEVEAMRYDRTVARSEGYRAGYNWALRQNKDYLMQHFSLYFDEWNEKGLGSLSREQLQTLDRQTEIGSILVDATRANALDFIESEKENAQTGVSVRQAFLTGILTAVKELRLNEFFSTRTCETFYSAAEDVVA